jgi:hypothetical protein
VNAGIFHHFHLYWIGEIARSLNAGLLPSNFYALGEQVTTGGNPDVIALEEAHEESLSGDTTTGGTALLTTEPKARVVAEIKESLYLHSQRQIAIRHKSGDRVVALIEIVSSGNKASELTLKTFLSKMCTALDQGIHLLIIDLYPPTPRDPEGLHGAFMDYYTGDEYTAPTDANRTIASYRAGISKTAFVEPMALNQSLGEMPLYLTQTGYIQVPLEETYQVALTGVPARYRQLLSSTQQ